jgi:hypothetical protein
MQQSFLLVLDDLNNVKGAVALGTFTTFTGAEATYFVAGQVLTVFKRQYFSPSAGLQVNYMATPFKVGLPNFFSLEDILPEGENFWQVTRTTTNQGKQLTGGSFLERFLRSGGVQPSVLWPYVDTTCSFIAYGPAGYTITFQDTSTCLLVPTTAFWHGSDGSVNGGAATAVVTFPVIPSVDVFLTGQDANGHTFTSSTKTIPLPFSTTAAPAPAPSPSPSPAMKTWSLSANLSADPACSSVDLPFTGNAALYTSALSKAVRLEISGVPPISVSTLRPFLITDTGFPSFPGSYGNKIRWVKMSAATLPAGLYVYTLLATFLDGTSEFVTFNLTIA